MEEEEDEEEMDDDDDDDEECEEEERKLEESLCLHPLSTHEPPLLRSLKCQHQCCVFFLSCHTMLLLSTRDASLLEPLWTLWVT